MRRPAAPALSNRRRPPALPLLAGLAALVLALLGTAAAEERSTALERERSAAPDGVLSLSAPSLRAYVEGGAPRAYALFVLFVVADADKCAPCAPMRAALGRAAAQYHALPRRDRAPHPVFFAEMRLALDNRALLQDYAIEHVPILFHFAPSAAGGPTFPRPLSSLSREGYPIEQLGVSANAIKSFVNRKTGARLQVMRGDYQIPFASSVRAMMPALLFAAAALAAVAVFLGWVYSPMFWFTLCVLVYLYSVGGGHYTWINNTPFAVVDSNGRSQYVSEGSRNQYAAEGMFVSLTCSAISAIVIGINELPRLLVPGHKQTTVGFVLIAVVFVSTCTLLGLYNLKMPSYLRYDQ